MLKQRTCYQVLIALAGSLLFKQAGWAQSGVRTDSIQIAIAPAYDSVGKLHRFFLGNGYRKDWATPVMLRICYLSAEKGGMKVLKPGGGQQTKSLRLQDASGKEWVLRSIQKYPEQGLPPGLRQGLAKDILQDQVVTAQPFAALTVPPLAAALGIPHANLEIIYLANDPALGQYANSFAHAVYLLEEREPVEEADTDNTSSVQLALETYHGVKIDQPLLLRARLLDMLLGDWDRHEDQWRWKQVGKKKSALYQPVPRDRDMVFYNTSGLLPWIVSHQWLKSKFQGFHDNLRDVNGFNFNARYFDRYFLNEASEEDWKATAEYLQLTLTDSLLESAVKKMPFAITDRIGLHLLNTLKSRRAHLVEWANQYYRFIAQTVTIRGSSEKEIFTVSRQLQQVQVQVNAVKKDGTLGANIYQRSFDPAITKEIEIFGLGGSDVFKADSGLYTSIHIRWIGGIGNDSFEVLQPNRSIYIYDKKDEINGLPAHRYAHLRLSNDSNVQVMDRKSFRYNRLAPLILASYSLDEGIQLRGGFFQEVQGFRKTPYAFKQELAVNYSFGRKAFQVNYQVIFKQIYRHNDLHIDVNTRGPQNLSNFFGIGNQSVFVNQGSQKISYYRSRYDFLNAAVSWHHPFSQKWEWYVGPALQLYSSKASNNNNKFFDQYQQTHPDAGLYGNRTYLGAEGGVQYDSRNNESFPSKGARLLISFKALQQLKATGKGYTQWLASYSKYWRVGNNQQLVIANRVGGGALAGDPAFFQLLYLGGAQTMRGFHTNRFAGKLALYDNIECRLKLFDFNAYLLPGSVGLIGFNDIGRVWIPGESSAQWHSSYGGGIYIVPAQLFILQAVMGFSKEGNLPYITLGFRF